jgi:hypothetical protein
VPVDNYLLFLRGEKSLCWIEAFSPLVLLFNILTIYTTQTDKVFDPRFLTGIHNTYCTISPKITVILYTPLLYYTLRMSVTITYLFAFSPLNRLSIVYNLLQVGSF